MAWLMSKHAWSLVNATWFVLLKEFFGFINKIPGGGWWGYYCQIEWIYEEIMESINALLRSLDWSGERGAFLWSLCFNRCPLLLPTSFIATPIIPSSMTKIPSKSCLKINSTQPTHDAVRKLYTKHVLSLSVFRGMLIFIFE